MKGLVATLLRAIGPDGRRTRAKRAIAASEPSDCSSCDERDVAQALSKTLERAVALGLWQHADRVAQSAARLAEHHAELAERIAHLRCAQNEPDAALAIVESCKDHPASLRMLRCALLLQLGRSHEAHLDLREWARMSTAPLQARLMLALLEWRAGDAHAAIADLLRNLKHMDDPHTLAALVLIGVAQGRTDFARAWAKRLRRACGRANQGSHYTLMLSSLGMHDVSQAEAPLEEPQVRLLAAELIAREDVVSVLVEVQCRRLDPPAARLLAGAIEQALPNLDDRAAAFFAMARLAITLNDPAAAALWAQRGLEAHPLSADLARMADALRHAPADHLYQREDVLATIGQAPLDASAESLRERAA